LPTRNRLRSAAGLVVLLSLGFAPRYPAYLAAQAPVRATVTATAVVAGPARLIGWSTHSAREAWGALGVGTRATASPVAPAGRWARLGTRHLRLLRVPGPGRGAQGGRIEIADLGS
jgi:hypothetical protein